MPEYFGRKRPYTATGIRRVPCVSCGDPSSTTWQTCANGNRHVPICTACDIGLNELVLGFFDIPNRHELMLAYRRSKQ